MTRKLKKMLTSRMTEKSHMENERMGNALPGNDEISNLKKL